MKKFVSEIFCLLFLLGIASTVFTSCQKEEKQYLEVNPTSLNFDSEQGSQNIIISSNGKWKISTSEEWLDVGFIPSSSLFGDLLGEGDKTEEIWVKQNTSINSRNAIIVISQGSLQQVVNVYQSGLTTLSAPTNVTAYQNAQSITIGWNAVVGATSYSVYRSDSANGTYSLIATHGTTPTNLQVNDNNPDAGVLYYYKVKAFSGSIESEYSNYVSCKFLKDMPGIQNLTANLLGNNTYIRLTWDNDSTCRESTSFEIYKHNPNTDNYDLIQTQAGTLYSYSDAILHPGINQYRVDAINSNSSWTTMTKYVSSLEVPLDIPADFTYTQSGKDILFTWSSVNAATGYEIFVSSSANDESGKLNHFNIDQSTTSYAMTLYSLLPYIKNTRYCRICAKWESPYGGQYPNDHGGYYSGSVTIYSNISDALIITF